MKVVIAIDSFKGSISSLDAGAAIREGIHRVFPDAEVLVRPLADGGEGTVEALARGMNGRIRTVTVTGPLGTPVEIKNYGTVAVVGGGVGIAEVYPIARAFKEAGNRVIAVLGARTKDLLILEPEMRALCDKTVSTTDDGSFGMKGMVTDAIQKF